MSLSSDPYSALGDLLAAAAFASAFLDVGFELIQYAGIPRMPAADGKAG